jgi:repressor LexA
MEKEEVNTRERIYQYIIKYISNMGYSPTIREIGDAVGLKSTSSVYTQLLKLENEGKIEMKPCSCRTIKVVGYEYKKVEE